MPALACPPIVRRAAALGLVLLIGAACAPQASAQRTPGSIGIGGQLGDPSGVTLKFYNGRGPSWDFLAAWDSDDFFFLNVHALYERHLGRRPDLHFFYGPGGFVGFRDRGEEDDVEAGISGSFGVGFLIEQFEIYGQLTPRLSVVPDTDGDLGAGLGVRFYF